MNKYNELQNEQLEKVMLDFIHAFFQDRKTLAQQSVVECANDKQVAALKKIGIPEQGRDINQVTQEMIEQVYKYRTRLNHPRHLGLVPGPASLVSWFGDVMTRAYNVLACSWQSASGASCIEQSVIEWLCSKAGYPTGSSGIFVSGGSVANMTALIAARDTKLTEDELHLGVAYISEQTHSSVAKGLRIIGIPNSRIRKIGCDEHYRINLKQLEIAIQQDKQKGLKPFVIIATAGTTNTGSIDPLPEISALCRQYNLWMHVDGAIGASVLLTQKYAHLLKGIELSDSLSWDAHKWLFQTYSCGIVLVKKQENLLNSFNANPEYLQDLKAQESQINYWDLGIELTRPARGLKLWLTLQIIGAQAISQCVEHGFELAKLSEAEIMQYPDWQIVSHAQLAMVNFRYAPAGYSKEQLDQINHQISQSIINSGYAGVYTTVLDGKVVLRICAINPETTHEDIKNTVKLLNQYAIEIQNATMIKAM